MDFEILHSIEGALSVDIAYAPPGENGEMQNFGNLQYYDNSKTTFSPIIGIIFDLFFPSTIIYLFFANR